ERYGCPYSGATTIPLSRGGCQTLAHSANRLQPQALASSATRVPYPEARKFSASIRRLPPNRSDARREDDLTLCHGQFVCASRGGASLARTAMTGKPARFGGYYRQ